MSPENNPYNGGTYNNPFGTSQKINTNLGRNPYAASAEKKTPNKGTDSAADSNSQHSDIKINVNNTNPYAAKPQNQYLRQKVETATQGELTLMLFEGCCKFLGRVKDAFELRANSPDPKVRIAQINEINTNIIKSQNIIMELMTSLNFDYDISHKLYPVYNYLYRELVRINFAKDPKGLDAVIDIMQDYYETWKEVVKIDRQNKYSGGQDGSFA